MNISPNKKLGQHFLIDNTICTAITNSIYLKDNNTILEIGPGLGILTMHIINTISKKKFLNKFIMIEKDSRFIEKLNNIINSVKTNNIQLINQDALKYNIKDILDTKSNKMIIVSNLPYNISIPLMTNWMYEINSIDSIIVMIQLEVAERILASCKTKSYGKLSILVQSLCDVEKVCHVSKRCFFPQPKVESMVIKITPKPNQLLSLQELQTLSQLTSALFLHKRKRIGKYLTTHLLKNNINIDNFTSHMNKDYFNNTRAEEIEINEYIKMAQYIKNLNQNC